MTRRTANVAISLPVDPLEDARAAVAQGIVPGLSASIAEARPLFWAPSP